MGKRKRKRQRNVVLFSFVKDGERHFTVVRHVRIEPLHGGTALRELVRREYGRYPQVLRLEAAGPGVTELVLREF